MCSTCGCNQPDGVTITRVQSEDFKIIDTTDNRFSVAHSDQPEQATQAKKQVIALEQDILDKNNRKAAHNRFHLESQGILAINMVSSPGSGKTTLLEATLCDLKNKFPFYVIEGDQQTTNDARRIASTGSEVVQINTGKGCHLDADMVHHAIHELNPKPDSILFIENVGNLVCPALFDLGEAFRVVVISVTEGDDKPLKYPDIFQTSDLCVINKSDLLHYVDFSVDRLKEYGKAVNPQLEFVLISATTKHGLDSWYQWLKEKKQIMSTLKTEEILTK